MTHFKTRSLALCMGLTLSVAAHAQMAQPLPSLTPPAVLAADATKLTIAADYKADKAACDALAGNTKDICSARAHGRQNVALAELEVRKSPGHKSTYKASVAQADAVYDETKQRCDDKAGNVKDVCMKEAKAAHTTGKADAVAVQKASVAKSDEAKTSSQAKAKATDKVTDAKQEAAVDKRKASYDVAKEKCDALSGAPKDTCLEKAKASFGPL